MAWSTFVCCASCSPPLRKQIWAQSPVMVAFWLDCCNMLDVGLPLKIFWILHLVQNTSQIANGSYMGEALLCVPSLSKAQLKIMWDCLQWNSLPQELPASLPWGVWEAPSLFGFNKALHSAVLSGNKKMFLAPAGLVYFDVSGFFSICWFHFYCKLFLCFHIPISCLSAIHWNTG